jgi:hypothetical protein
VSMKCTGNSNSFIEGCTAHVEENDPASTDEAAAT